MRPPEAVAPTPTRLAQARSRARLILEGMLVGAAAALAGGWMAELVKLEDSSDKPAKVANSVLDRGIVWALVGAALATWLTLVQGGDRSGLVRRALSGFAVGALAGVLGGVIFGSRVLPHSTLVATVEQLSVGSAAVTGAILGALIGSLWTPPRLAAGLAAGFVAGALILVAVLSAGWDVNSPSERVLLAAIEALGLAGLVVLGLHALELGHKAFTRTGRLESPNRSGGRRVG